MKKVIMLLSGLAWLFLFFAAAEGQEMKIKIGKDGTTVQRLLAKDPVNWEQVWLAIQPTGYFRNWEKICLILRFRYAGQKTVAVKWINPHNEKKEYIHSVNPSQPAGKEYFVFSHLFIDVPSSAKFLGSKLLGHWRVQIFFNFNEKVAEKSFVVE